VTARPDDKLLTPSILDRLIDYEPDRSHDDASNQGQVLRELKEAIRRDLQDLLNSKRQFLTWPADYDELDYSLVNYGIADFTGVTFTGSDEQANLARSLERTILQFEPRLKSVRVQIHAVDRYNRQLRFQVNAMMQVYPSPEPVMFDSVMEPQSRSISVTSAAT